MDVLGLDIGGANLKAAHTSGAAASVPFALWRHPERLADELRRLVAPMPPWQRVAVTMTGELCDCFESKAHGVAHILDAASEVFGAAALDVWTNSGQFSDARTAKDCWLLPASANWLALATFAGRFVPSGQALLLDIGTTTTDLIPLRDGRPTPRGFTDPERMRSGELIYRGWRRTPLCAVFPGPGVAAEFFATMHDACLVAGLVPEDADDRDTADGRPATVEAALHRIARMRCADAEEMSEGECRELAGAAVEQFAVVVEGPLRRLMDRHTDLPSAVIVSGSGSFLADVLLESVAVPRILLDERIGPSASAAACAYAVATLRAEAGWMDVVKVGGSLFVLPDLRQRLSAFLPALLVPGGGALADAVRDLDRVHGLGDEASHWLALRACTVNAHFLAGLLNLPVVDHPTRGPSVLDPFAFLLADEGNPGALPHSWDATADSVAARVAEVGGMPLVLLKSAEPGAADFVDPLFPAIVARAGLSVRAVNLRVTPMPS